MDFLNLTFHIVEVLAAIAGTYFIIKRKSDGVLRYFVYYLWLTVFVETVGVIPRIIDSKEYLSFLKNTIWDDSDWLYNSYLVISFVMYITYFKSNVKNRLFKNISNLLIVIFVVASLLNFIVSDVFFNGFSSFSMIMGSIMLLLSVMLYFYEILQSDTILSFHKSIPFYIAIGALVFHLSITPLFIYNKYYSLSVSPGFVKIYQTIREIAIIFMYSCYTIGFIVCLKKKKSYS